jgi:mono/diheme cytochrome c family protein
VRSISTVFVAVVLIGGMSYAWQEKGSETLSPAAQDGQRIFQTHCAMCHVGVTVGTEVRQAAATGPFAPLVSKTTATDEKTTREKIQNGGPRMPGYKWSLQNDQVDHVIAYLKTLDAPLTRITSPRPGE